MWGKYNILKVLLFLTFIMAACSGDKVPHVTANVDGCKECNMVITRVNEACGYYTDDNEFLAFDSPGCLLRNLHRLRESGTRFPDQLYFADYRTEAFSPADSTWFLLTDHIPTVMNGRVICFSNKKQAEQQKQFEDELVTNWQGYYTARGIPDTIIKTVWSKQVLIPGTFQVKKGDLVQFVIDATNTRDDVSLEIRGYPELTACQLTSEKPNGVLRILATRPGAGFPVVNTLTQQTVGMLKVIGPHTTDEEAM